MLQINNGLMVHKAALIGFGLPVYTVRMNVDQLEVELTREVQDADMMHLEGTDYSWAGENHIRKHVFYVRHPRLIELKDVLEGEDKPLPHDDPTPNEAEALRDALRSLAGEYWNLLVELDEYRTANAAQSNMLREAIAPTRVETRIMRAVSESELAQMKNVGWEVVHMQFVNFDLNVVLQRPVQRQPQPERSQQADVPMRVPVIQHPPYEQQPTVVAVTDVGSFAVNWGKAVIDEPTPVDVPVPPRATIIDPVARRNDALRAALNQPNTRRIREVGVDRWNAEQRMDIVSQMFANIRPPVAPRPFTLIPGQGTGTALITDGGAV